MNLIDPKGLLEGERLAACSDLAQLHWPRLFSAANGFARLELSFQAIVSNVYRGFQKPPTEDEFLALIEEYANNFLAIVYESGGVWWVQFITSEKYLPRYKTARDNGSPSPSAELMDKHLAGYIEWKRVKSFKNQRFQKFTENFGNLPKISDAVAVAVAVEVAVGKQEQQNTLVQLASEIGRDRHLQIVEGCFSLYCSLLKRDPRRYSLTLPRKAKAIVRLKEREKVNGSLELAENDLRAAIQNLAASEFHTSHRFIDWLDHIFKSREIFEKRLNWAAPDIGAKGKPVNQEWVAFKAEEGLEIHDQTRDGEALRAVMQ